MATGKVSQLVQGTKSISKRLIFSYVLDWVFLAIFGFVSLGFSYITPNYRPFSLLDLSISYPFIPETISIAVVGIVSVVAPAAIIVGVVFLFVPGPAGWKRMTAGEILRIKLWEINVGVLGLAMAHVTQFLFVQGLKSLLGKPRPNLIDRCQPDLANFQNYIVGGYGQDISPRWVLVDWKICQQTDQDILQDGFRSFPSGHNTTVYAGMLYLTLYLASKFGIGFPVIPFHKRDFASTRAETRVALPRTSGSSKATYRDYREFGYRDEAAAAPTWTLFAIYIPMGVAVYIGSTRYFDYYHQGFDVFVSSIIGMICGYIGFRWYHGPLGRSAGWAWSPRSRDRAFGIGVGTSGWVTDPADPDGERRGQDEIELRTRGGPQQAESSGRQQRQQQDSIHSSPTDERTGYNATGREMV